MRRARSNLVRAQKLKKGSEGLLRDVVWRKCGLMFANAANGVVQHRKKGKHQKRLNQPWAGFVCREEFAEQFIRARVRG